MCNKSDRPLPSGRITLHAARLLRWMLFPVCLLLSALYSARVAYASLSLAFCTVLYNELHASSAHWILKNFLNAGGYAAFEAGATLIAGTLCRSATLQETYEPSASDYSTLDSATVLALCLNAGIIFTTIHTQDFKDVEGDRMIGRKTMPIVHPKHSRKTVIIGLLTWSVILAFVWRPDAMTALGFLCLAAFVGIRFLRHTSVLEDQMSYYLYNVSCPHCASR